MDIPRRRQGEGRGRGLRRPGLLRRLRLEGSTRSNARTGKLIWTAKAQPRLGHSAEFYATPAIAYGRVFIGSTDGKEYAFGAATGHLLWSQSTGDYVYSSAAVWRRRIYAGSYNGKLYCFDAATGDVRWTFKANGPISGSPTVMAGRVYFSTLKRRTYALDATTGRGGLDVPGREVLAGRRRREAHVPRRLHARLRLRREAREAADEHRAGSACRRACRRERCSLPILMYHRVRRPCRRAPRSRAASP